MDEQFLYKCRRCGKHDISTECGGGSGWRHLKNAIFNIREGSDMPLPMISSHACADGGHGITDLIGCEPIPPSEGEPNL